MMAAMSVGNQLGPSASGGSTNAVLHLLAIAATAEIQLTIDDFQRISDKTALIADLKPSGKFRMEASSRKFRWPIGVCIASISIDVSGRASRGWHSRCDEVLAEAGVAPRRLHDGRGTQNWD